MTDDSCMELFKLKGLHQIFLDSTVGQEKQTTWLTNKQSVKNSVLRAQSVSALVTL